MRQCELTRRANTESRLNAQLQAVLDYCAEFGHRPAADSETDLVYQEIRKTVSIRNAKKVPIPENIIAGLEHIKKYPTAKAYALNNAKKHISSDSAHIEDLIAKQVQYMPKLRLMRAIVGEEEYKRMLEKPTNAFDLKILSAYVDFAIEILQMSRHRDIEIVLKAYGVHVSRNYLQKLRQLYINGELKRPNKTYVPHRSGLSVRELSYAFDLSEVRIGQILNKTLPLLRNHTGFRRMFEYYMGNNTDGMIAELSAQQQYNYQRPLYRPTDIRTIDAWLQKQY